MNYVSPLRIKGWEADRRGQLGKAEAGYLGTDAAQ
jgi:hypothetical protein